MSDLDSLELLFVVWAFLFQFVLIIHFALRKWLFDVALRYGTIVYALSIPAALISILLLAGDKTWSLWLAGFIYLIWAVFGFTVEYVKQIQWRNPILLSIFVPYVVLYLATVMLYWWSLAVIWRPLWYIYAVLFVISTVLNVTSHQRPQTPSRVA